jgi:hypothetical protein
MWPHLNSLQRQQTDIMVSSSTMLRYEALPLFFVLSNIVPIEYFGSRPPSYATERKRLRSKKVFLSQLSVEVTYPPAVAFVAANDSLILLKVTVASTNETLNLQTDESYNLTIPNSAAGQTTGLTATITANTVFGALRGMETFSQLIRFAQPAPFHSLLYFPAKSADSRFKDMTEPILRFPSPLSRSKTAHDSHGEGF